MNKNPLAKFRGHIASSIMFWLSIIRENISWNYESTKSKSTFIASPTLRYMHYLIVHTIAGKKGKDLKRVDNLKILVLPKICLYA